MAVNWYCQIGGQPQGPFSSHELQLLAQKGSITPSTPLRRGEQGSWVRASQVRGLWPKGAPPKQTQPAQTQPLQAHPLQTQAVGELDQQVNDPGPKPHLPPPLPKDRKTQQSAVTSPGSAPPQRKQAGKSGASGLLVAKPLDETPNRVATAHTPPQVTASPNNPQQVNAPPVSSPPASIPMGVAIDPATGLPVGQPSPPPSYVSTTSSAAPLSQGDQPSSLALRRRRSNAAVLWIILGAFGVIGLAAGVYAVTMTSPSRDDQEAPAVSQANATGVQDNADPEVDPQGSGNNGKAAASSASHDAAKSKTGKAESKTANDKDRGILGNVTRWRDGSTVKGIVLGDFQLRIEGLWLGAKKTTRPASPAQTAIGTGAAPNAGDSDPAIDPVLDIRKLREEKPPTKDGAVGEIAPSNQDSKKEAGEVGGNKSGKVASGPPAKFVFVRLQIANKSTTAPLRYTSWNSGVDASPPTCAAMDDNAGNVLKRVSYSDAPANDRLQSADIQPGAAVSDLLIFELPETEFQKLRLALPYAAVGKKGYVGFEFSRSMLARAAD